MSNAIATARIASRCLASGSTRALSGRAMSVRSLAPGNPFSGAHRRRNALSKDGFLVMASMNITTAVTKKYETMKLPDIASAPVSALEGIAEVREKALNNLKVKTVRDLGEWKYYR